MRRRWWVFGALLLTVTLWQPVVADASPTLRRIVVVLDDSAGDPGAVASEHGHRYGFTARHVFRYALRGYAASVGENRVDDLRADSRVLFVSHDAEVTTRAQLLPTGINRIDGDLSSTRSGDGSGAVNVNVAVIDTGIQSSHPDLNVIGGTDCTRGKTNFEDDDGHGTFVGGVVGAKDNDIGVVGVAPAARLWAVKVLRKGGVGTLSTVLCGVDWVTSTRQDTDPTNDIAVANMSLGGKGADDANCGLTNKDALHAGICRSVAAGVTYVTASANTPIDLQEDTPSGYDEVLAVTAMADFDGQPGALNGPICAEQDDTIVDSIGFATLASDRAHIVAAPGRCIFSTTIGSNYRTGSGTSFATPHVAGTVALCISNGSCAGLTPRQIIQRVVSEAAAYNTANPSYGYLGDPLRPLSERYYGFLVRTALY